MPFKKGNSGNPNGRKKGVPNKITQDLRESLQSFLETNGANFQAIFDQLEPKDKIRYYIDLLPFVVPKLQSTQLMVEDNSPPVVVTINKDNIFKFPNNFDEDDTTIGANDIFIE
jgi:hypothetical protein